MRNSRFASLLKEGLWSVAHSRQWTVEAVKRDITEELRHQGFELKEHTVAGWCRGIVPSPPEIVDWLMRYGVGQGHLNQRWAMSLLQQARHPRAAELLQEVFPTWISTPASAGGLPSRVGDETPIGGPVLLPPAPQMLAGRSEDLERLLQALQAGGPGLYVLSGMVGVGKSALAAEALHQIASDPALRGHFADGLLAVSAHGRQGPAGLSAVAAELLTSLAGTNQPWETWAPERLVPYVRQVLARKRTLLLLDDVHPHFPLRPVLEMLMVQSQAASGCTLLLTTWRVPPPGRVRFHLPLVPLTIERAVEGLARLVGQPFAPVEHAAVRQLCAAVGGVPLALEWAAQALRLGVTLDVLVRQLTRQPLHPVLDSQGEVAARLGEALEGVPAELQVGLARLHQLGSAPFRLEQALPLLEPVGGREEGFGGGLAAEGEAAATQSARVSRTAAALAQLATHSLVLLPGPGWYQVPPLLRAYVAARPQAGAEPLRLIPAPAGKRARRSQTWIHRAATIPNREGLGGETGEQKDAARQCDSGEMRLS